MFLPSWEARMLRRMWSKENERLVQMTRCADGERDESDSDVLIAVIDEGTLSQTVVSMVYHLGACVFIPRL